MSGYTLFCNHQKTNGTSENIIQILILVELQLFFSVLPVFSFFHLSVTSKY